MRFIKTLCLYALFSLILIKKLCAFSFYGITEFGAIFSPYMATQLQIFQQELDYKQIVVQQQNIISPDFKTDLSFNWEYAKVDLSLEYSHILHDVNFSVSHNRDKCDYVVFCNLNRTYFKGYSTESRYDVEDTAIDYGAKLTFNTEIIRNRVNAGASVFINGEAYNNIKMISLVEGFDDIMIESKNFCFAVGFDSSISFFKVIKIGAKMTSWQYRDKESTSLIGSFVPIQIRNVFYAQLYHTIGRHFAVDLGLDYFCDHPEVTWNTYRNVDRSNQSYFVLRTCFAIRY